KGEKGETSSPRYLAFVLTRDKPVLLIDLKEAEPIEKAWTAWHKAITAPRPSAATERKAAAEVARLVWRPLRAHLPAKVDTVYLCPDGALTQVPFAALPGTKAGTVLLEEVAV